MIGKALALVNYWNSEATTLSITPAPKITKFLPLLF